MYFGFRDGKPLKFFEGQVTFYTIPDAVIYGKENGMYYKTFEVKNEKQEKMLAFEHEKLVFVHPSVEKEELVQFYLKKQSS